MPPKKNQKSHPIDSAIQSVLDQLTDHLDEAAARKAIRDAVSNSLNRVLGGGQVVGQGKAGRVRSSGGEGNDGGGHRGPKPGGRQLKAHLGAKAFAALADDVKDKARKSIVACGPEWKTMATDAKNVILKKAGVPGLGPTKE